MSNVASISQWDYRASLACHCPQLLTVGGIYCPIWSRKEIPCGPFSEECPPSVGWWFFKAAVPEEGVRTKISSEFTQVPQLQGCESQLQQGVEQTITVSPRPDTSSVQLDTVQTAKPRKKCGQWWFCSEGGSMAHFPEDLWHLRTRCSEGWQKRPGWVTKFISSSRMDTALGSALYTLSSKI